MAYRVIWSDEVQEQIRDIQSYLLTAFGDAAADRFSDRLRKVSDLLEEMPRVGEQHPLFTAVREFPVQGHHLLAYTVVKQDVIVLNLIDSRRRNAK